MNPVVERPGRGYFPELRYVERRRYAWSKLLAGTRLVDELREMVSRGAVSVDANRWLSDCERYTACTTDAAWLRALTWCATEAARRPARYLDDRHRARFSMPRSLRSPPIGIDETWAWDCVRHLLPGLLVRSLSVDIALHHTGHRGGGARAVGSVARLAVGVVRGGSGALVQFAPDAARSRIDADFRSAMTAAWGAAIVELEARGKIERRQGRCVLVDRSLQMAAELGAAALGRTSRTRRPDALSVDGYWRVLDADGNPLEAVAGPSAAAAAARAWYHALGGTCPDDGVFVLGQAVSGRSHLFGRVEGIAAKTRAIARASAPGTIVCVDQANAAEAIGALNRVRDRNRPAVVLAVPDRGDGL